MLSIILLSLNGVRGQEEEVYVPYNVPSQNLLKFNRFLLNPTFSTVREDKSYINLFHRNQSVSFDDNNQVYFLSYSGRVSDRSGVGLSLFTNREGLFNNFGVHVNYAYGVRLGEKSAMTFGANFSYYQSAFNRNRANSLEEDPLLNTLESSSLVSFQPGINFSFGQFDIGGFAENLFDYNLKNSESVTTFDEKTYSGHLQYTHQFENGTGLMEQARLMPLARVRKVGDQPLTLGGNLILDLPKLGWIQAGYDDFYGASAGLGFNLTKNISLGYTVEKGLSNNFQNFGVSHEISLAYSFTPNLTEDRVLLEDENEEVVQNDSTPKDSVNMTQKDWEIAELRQKLKENDAILNELMMRQDSIETTRKQDLERRFETVMKLVKRETAGQNPELEEKVKQVYFADMDTIDIVSARKQPLSNDGMSNTTATKKVIRLNEKSTDRDAFVESRAKRDNTVNSLSASKVHYKSHSVPNVEGGHYLIANVFKGERHTQAFINQLEAQGVEADYFTNPRNGMHYVYVGEYQNKEQAFEAHRSKLNGNYLGEVWVMNVNEGTNNTALAHNTTKEKTATSKYGNDFLQKNVAKNVEGSPSGVRYSSQTGDGIASGFYIIAQVFESSSAAKKFVKQLNANGLHASYFINPNDNQRYVYLKKHETWGNALSSYYTKLDASYNDDMWILRIKPNQTV